MNDGVPVMTPRILPLTLLSMTLLESIDNSAIAESQSGHSLVFIRPS